MFAGGLQSKALAIVEELERAELELAELESHRVFRSVPGTGSSVFEVAEVEAWLAETFEEGTRFVTEAEALQLLAAEEKCGTRYATDAEFALIAALNA